MDRLVRLGTYLAVHGTALGPWLAVARDVGRLLCFTGDIIANRPRPSSALMQDPKEKRLQTHRAP